MDYDLRAVRRRADLPDEADFVAHRREWLATAVDELADLGRTGLTVDLLMRDFWEETAAFFDPGGVTILALDAKERLLGSGALRTIGPGRGDLKRLYVRPAARGLGLGRVLAEARIAAGLEMGMETLFTNTIITNNRMLEIYEALGFVRVPRFPECHEPPEMDDILIYLRKDL